MTTQHDDCPHCKTGTETYRCKYFGKKYLYDVGLARSIVLDGRAPVEVEPDCRRTEIEETKIHRQHLPHADTNHRKRLGSSSRWRNRSWPFAHGNHRAARCLELNIPYFVHVLTEEESYRCGEDRHDVRLIQRNLNRFA